MLWYTTSYSRLPSIDAIRREQNHIDGAATSESILHVFETRVVLRSLIGNYVHKSYRFMDTAKVTVVAWVHFDSGDPIPWLAVLLQSNVLVLHAPDGSQVETSLPFHAIGAWPISLDAGEGIIFQRSHRTTDKQFCATLFSMTHPFRDLRPIRQSYANDDASVECSIDRREEVLFVIKDNPGLAITYDSVIQRHSVWCLLIPRRFCSAQGSKCLNLATSISNRLRPCDSPTHKIQSEDSEDAVKRPTCVEYSSLSDLCAQQMKFSNHGGIRTSSYPAIRAFRADDECGPSLLCLLLTRQSDQVTLL